ncbi:hypothetical protein ROA7023_02814 [Roseisalinus antarcticus]|uniref:DUF4396 domain-containing protein n=1 Tax=Roseisalinus antarcticus TaxID=254357 RepID=A0A1Y5TCE2_9RHOB|nr:hypothetical protein ROA7023_02814 [Roseisalinus antarcticus]
MTDWMDNPWFLGIWVALALPSLALVAWDLHRNNAHLISLMKVVWLLTVAYSGPIGLLIYWRTGRKEIPDDSIWRRSFRSVAHCYSGCGLGEIVGVTIAVGIFAMGNTGTALLTFTLAYMTGFGLTLGPLM